MEIYDLIEENNIFYIVIDNNDEILGKLDKLLKSNELNIIKEMATYGSPITKEEIDKLFNMGKSMCKIFFQNIDENNKPKEGKGSGFFCEIDKQFPIKYALFTNNHVLNESSFNVYSKITIKYFKKTFFNNYEIDEREI